MSINEINLADVQSLMGSIPDMPNEAKAANTEIGKLQELISTLQRLDKLAESSGIHKWFVPGTPFGIENCPKHKAFFDAGAIYPEREFLAGNRCGKAQPNSEPVLTPTGWVPMGNLEVGNYVIGSDGLPTEVVAVHPQGVRPIYKVTTTDGSSTLCDEEHLWQVRRIDKGASSTFVVMDTKSIQESSSRWALPQRPLVETPELDLPIDPYLLGLIIGDGGTSQSTVMYTTEDQQLVDYCTDIAPNYGCVFTKRGNLTYQFVSKKNNFKGKNYNMLKDLLDGLGLRCASHTKRLPEEYLWGSAAQRIALLQGLMDTDGTCGKNGQATFYSVSKGLCEDVAHLVRSLGVNATVLTKNGRYKDEHHLSYLVHIRKTTAFNPFRLERKASRFMGPSFMPRPLIVEKIEYVGEMEATCITVSAEDSLYVTNNFLITHNSVAGAYEAACHATGEYPSWWEGKTFDRPTSGWALGSTARATRDTVQKELIGPVGAWGTGMIPRSRIGDWWALAGVPQGIDIVKIKHVPTGGWSTIGFKNYEQPLEAFYGTAMDWIWTDEEVPLEIYNELLIRTMTTKGIIFNTFTPLKGLSPTVVRFAEKADYLAGAVPLIGLPEREDG